MDHLYTFVLRQLPYVLQATNCRAYLACVKIFNNAVVKLTPYTKANKRCINI